MANLPQSGTAGGPPGTMFEGPIFVREEQGSTRRPYPTAIACIGPFCKQNMTANAEQLMSLAEVAGVTGWVAHKAGSIVGLTVSRNTVNTAGTWTVHVRKNGTTVLSPAGVTARSLQFYTSNLASITFSAGDRIVLNMRTNGAYSAASGDFAGFFWIQ